MTDPGVERPPLRVRGGARLSAVLPGLPQLLAGRWGVGTMGLLVWVGFMGILTLRWSRFAAAWAGPGDHRIAALTVTTGLVVAWWWSMRDVRHPRSAEGETSQWELTARAFRKNRVAVVGLIALVSLYLVALVTPLIALHDPIAQFSLTTERMLAPGGSFPLGTDGLARDVSSRILYGARISLSIGFVAVGISVTIGTLPGAVSGFLGGKADAVIMRFVDMVISFPPLVLLIAIIAVFNQSSIFLIVAVLGFTQWPGTTRLVRGEVLSLRERDFIQAARALGFRRTRIVLRHVIPNSMAPVIVAATLGIGNVIILEAGLSFLGVGIQPPQPSWGSMVADGRANLLGGWWISTFPGLAIVFTVVAFNLVGDGLRDTLDPRLRT